MTRDEYRWFMSHGLGERIVMGNDFYERNEQIIACRAPSRPAKSRMGRDRAVFQPLSPPCYAHRNQHSRRACRATLVVEGIL